MPTVCLLCRAWQVCQSSTQLSVRRWLLIHRAVDRHSHRAICKVITRTETWFAVLMYQKCYGLTTAWAACRRPLIGYKPASPCEIWGGRSGTGTCLVPVPLRFFPCQYHSFSTPYSYIHPSLALYNTSNWNMYHTLGWLAETCSRHTWKDYKKYTAFWFNNGKGWQALSSSSWSSLLCSYGPEVQAVCQLLTFI
jgi:hypothetical protein